MPRPAAGSGVHAWASRWVVEFGGVMLASPRRFSLLALHLSGWGAVHAGASRLGEGYWCCDDGFTTGALVSVGVIRGYNYVRSRWVGLSFLHITGGFFFSGLFLFVHLFFYIGFWYLEH